MFTPQEIQEKTFVKAVFGGYDMQTVDEFLEPLTEDYITLYKENAVLKSKMKVLVEKLEEYRNQEASMRNALLTAQRNADTVMAEAEKKAARMMAEAQTAVQAKTSDADQLLSAEEQRVNEAKQTAQSFIENLEREIRSHLELLDNLKKQDLAPTNNYSAPRRQKPFDYDQEEAPLVVPKPAAEPLKPAMETPKPEAQKAETAEDIASEIEQNISRLMDLEEPVETAETTRSRVTSSTIKFTGLQFGPNYDPTAGK